MTCPILDGPQPAAGGGRVLTVGLMVTRVAADHPAFPGQWALPALGLVSLASSLRRQLPQVEVVVAEEEAELQRLRPDLVGLSAATENLPLAEAQAVRLGEGLGVPVILGGPHVTALPASLPGACAVGVVGEGEVTLVELVRGFLERGSFSPEWLREVPGLVFREPSGEVVTSPPRPLLEPLDRVDLAVAGSLGRGGVGHLVTSRGCRFRCRFCSSAESWGPYRAHSVEVVAAGVRRLVDDLGAVHVKFFDDLFVGDRERLLRLSERLVGEGLCPERGFSCFASARLLDEASVAALAALGTSDVAVGIESASPELLARLKPGHTVDQQRRALALLAGAGIGVVASFLIGVPGETEADLEASLDFIHEHLDCLSELEVCPAVPYPGTWFWRAALETGLVSESMDWSRLRDGSDLETFDPDRYLYLNPALPRERFDHWLAAFRELYRRVNGDGAQSGLNLAGPRPPGL